MDENYRRRRRRNRRQLAAIGILALVATAFPHVFCRGQRLEVGQSSAAAYRQLSLSGASDATRGISWFFYVNGRADANTPKREPLAESRWYELADGTGLYIAHTKDEGTGEIRVSRLCHFPLGLGKETGGRDSSDVDSIALPQATIWFLSLLR